MLSGCYIPCPAIQKYNMRYKIDKSSGTWFDPPDNFYGRLYLFKVNNFIIFFSND